jgi:hypothetical protein
MPGPISSNEQQHDTGDTLVKLSMPQQDLRGEQARGREDEIGTLVWELLTAMDPNRDQAERRGDNRYPFPSVVYLTPVREDGVAAEDQSLVAAGKDLSEGGVGFYHPMPLPSRRMIVSLQMANGPWLEFLTEVLRSCSIRQGWYESSGRFVQAVRSPMESA